MKTNPTLFYLKKFSVYSSLALLGLTQSCTVTENVHATESKKARPSGKVKDVRIYPDIIKKVMHVKNAEDSDVDFFVFDSHGTILVHYKMYEGEHKKINGLERGSYTYQVFKNDEMSESGKFMIK